MSEATRVAGPDDGRAGAHLPQQLDGAQYLRDAPVVEEGRQGVVDDLLGRELGEGDDAGKGGAVSHVHLGSQDFRFDG